MTTRKADILFFDGECVMCNSVVEWLVPRDQKRAFQFASLQGDVATHYRTQFPSFPTDLDTFVLITKDDEIALRSRAAFKVCSKLSLPWRLITIFRILPTFLTDAVYRFIAQNRIKWFGRQDSCWLPPEEEMDRFLDEL